MPRTPRRLVAIGDPQGPAAIFFAVLEHRGVLGSDGSVRDATCLVSLGDHFDYPPPRATAAPDAVDDVGQNGVRILSWLAREPPDRVVILLGNHDASRVIELVGFDDERFGAARRLATAIAEAESAEGVGANAAGPERDRFTRLFPEIPTPGLARRDFSSYSTVQRDLVRRLLCAGRYRLALAARLATHPEVEVLVTHAGVTERELGLLGIPDERRPPAIADALNGFLDRAVERVRPRWESGEVIALDLAPLHIAGTTGVEGGGLLYHRPADPDGEGDASWRFDPLRPRRFDPRRLPRGLVQACGHTPHAKNARELARWAAKDAPAEDGLDLRVLSVRGETVRYARWNGDRPPVDADSAALLLLDATLHRADPRSHPVLELLDPP